MSDLLPSFRQARQERLHRLLHPWPLGQGNAHGGPQAVDGINEVASLFGMMQVSLYVILIVLVRIEIVIIVIVIVILVTIAKH